MRCVLVVRYYPPLPALSPRAERDSDMNTKDLSDTDTAFIAGLPDEARIRVQALHPFRGLGRPEDIAKAALFLASEDNTWITGIGLPIDGGFTSM